MATEDHQRSVYFGGLFTIWAWKTVFDRAAKDIAHDLELRIKHGTDIVQGEVFALSLTPRAETLGPAAQVDSPVATKIIAEALPDELSAMGHRIVVSNQEIGVTGEIRRFWRHTETPQLYWDVIAEIQVNFAIGGKGSAYAFPREYSCRTKDRTYVFPPAKLLAQLLGHCIEELLAGGRMDDVWKR